MDRYFFKKSRDEKNGRNLSKSPVFSAVWFAKGLFSLCGSILITQHGRGRGIRTRDPRFWRPVLYQLSYTPVQRQYYSTHPAKKQGVSRKIRKLFCVQIAQQDPEAGDRQREVFRKIRAAYPVQTKIRTLVNRQKSGFCTGGDKGSRTPDLLNAIQALSQLSYTPVEASRDCPLPCNTRLLYHTADGLSRAFWKKLKIDSRTAGFYRLRLCQSSIA